MFFSCNIIFSLDLTSYNHNKTLMIFRSFIQQENLHNISSYLYMHHLFFKHMTSMCKTYKPMKKQFSHDFHYQLMGWEICDSRDIQITISNPLIVFQE
jgi:hypothetical protein